MFLFIKQITLSKAKSRGGGKREGKKEGGRERDRSQPDLLKISNCKFLLVVDLIIREPDNT